MRLIDKDFMQESKMHDRKLISYDEAQVVETGMNDPALPIIVARMPMASYGGVPLVIDLLCGGMSHTAARKPEATVVQQLA